MHKKKDLNRNGEAGLISYPGNEEKKYHHHAKVNKVSTGTIHASIPIVDHIKPVLEGQNRALILVCQSTYMIKKRLT